MAEREDPPTRDTPADGEGPAYPLPIAALLGDVGAAEIAGATVADVPEGAVLSAGTDLGGGTWTLDAAELAGVAITPPAGWSGTRVLTVRVRLRRPEDPQPSTVAFGVTLSVARPPAAPGSRPAPPPASADAVPAGMIEIALDIDTGFGAGDETMGVTIGGVPEDAVLSAGTDNGDGTWSLEPEDLAGLAIRLPEGADDGLVLGVTAFAADGAVSTGRVGVAAEDAVAEPAPEPEPKPEPEPEPAPGEAAAPEPAPEPERVPEPESEATPVPEPGPELEAPAAPAALAPIAYWKLDEPAPGAVRDETGGHHGQSEGGAAGEGGGAFDAVALFDGIDDHVTVADADAFRLAAGTLTLWFDAYAGGAGTLVAKGGPGDAGALELGIRSGGLAFVLSSDAGTRSAQGGAFGANEWNQAAATWGPGGMRVYLNGAPVAEDGYRGGLAAAGRPWVFGAAAGLGDRFHGELDDIAVYGFQMDDAQVARLARLGVAGLDRGADDAETEAAAEGGLDLSAIPSEADGPESLATVDAVAGPPRAEDAPEPESEPVAADSGIDLDAIPSEAEGPESLATVDAVAGPRRADGAPETEGGREPDATPEKPPGMAEEADDVFVFDAAAGGASGVDDWSETAGVPHDAGDAGDVVAVADGDDIAIEGGEDKAW